MSSNNRQKVFNLIAWLKNKLRDERKAFKRVDSFFNTVDLARKGAHLDRFAYRKFCLNFKN